MVTENNVRTAAEKAKTALINRINKESILLEMVDNIDDYQGDLSPVVNAIRGYIVSVDREAEVRNEMMHVMADFLDVKK